MTKKIRLIILLVCVACFFVIAPVLVLYSMGYRFDFVKIRITTTGGIYVRTYPAAEKIIIDSKITKELGMFSDSIFVQSLLPALHTVLIKKNGYYDYFKTLPVQEKEVTKIENVLLIKKNIKFEIIADKGPEGYPSPFDKQEKFIIKNNNLYYSSAPENADISATLKAIPILKSLVAFSITNNNIIWLGADGFLYRSVLTDLSAKTKTAPEKIILESLKINKNGSYKIISNPQNIFVNDNGNLLELNTKTNSLDSFASSIKDEIFSPDGKNIIYYNNSNIYISPLPVIPGGKVSLYKSSEKIGSCLWLNNNYIIFTAGNKIIISEIDYRGNTNTVTLPQTIAISPDQKIDIKSPEIFLNHQDGKLYILTNDILLLSEKITP
jgi:hypothetical protein